jgi:carbon monoxide dehydrogenase subunit G
LKIAGSYQLPVSQERAYQLLQDPVVLARCMPGCDRLDEVAPKQYEMKMKMALASISGLFDGKVRIADENPPDSFRLVVEGNGKIGFMKGDGLLKLTPAPTGTDVNYEGDVQVGGTIAGVGQRLLDSTSKMMIKRFFDKLGEAA